MKVSRFASLFASSCPFVSFVPSSISTLRLRRPRNTTRRNICHRDVSKTITTTAAIVRNRSSIHHSWNRRQRNSLPLFINANHPVHSSCSTDSQSPAFKIKNNLAITKEDIYNHLMGYPDDQQDDDDDDTNNNNNTGTNSTTSKRNVFSILTTSVDLLKECKAPEPEMSACHLFSRVLLNLFPRWEDNGFAVLAKILQGEEQDTASWYHHDDDNGNHVGKTQVTREQVDMYASMLERRIKNEPLQYIIGQWDFHNCVLKVRPPCLCPRPETEELVEYVAKDIRQMIELLRLESVGSGTCGRKVRILDVGCGTGAIGVALANMFPKDVIVSSMDVSEDAVALSVENAKFVLGDDFSLQYHHPVLCSAREYTRTHLNKDDDDCRFRNCTFEYDVVVSNPPYIPSHDMSTLTADVVEYEDYGALCGGLDGLDVVRDIVERLPEWCKVNHDNDDATHTNNGEGQRTRRPFPAVCWMEVDTSHPRLIQSLLANNKHVEYNCEIQDLSGMDRFVKFLVKD